MEENPYKGPVQSGRKGPWVALVIMAGLLCAFSMAHIIAALAGWTAPEKMSAALWYLSTGADVLAFGAVTVIAVARLRRPPA